MKGVQLANSSITPKVGAAGNNSMTILLHWKQSEADWEFFLIHSNSDRPPDCTPTHCQIQEDVDHNCDISSVKLHLTGSSIYWYKHTFSFENSLRGFLSLQKIFFSLPYSEKAQGTTPN